MRKFDDPRGKEAEESHLAGASALLRKGNEAARAAGELELALMPAYYKWLRDNRKNGVSFDSEMSALTNFFVGLVMPVSDLRPARALGAFKALSMVTETILVEIVKKDQAERNAPNSNRH